MIWILFIKYNAMPCKFVSCRKLVCYEDFRWKSGYFGLRIVLSVWGGWSYYCVIEVGIKIGQFCGKYFLVMLLVQVVFFRYFLIVIFNDKMLISSKLYKMYFNCWITCCYWRNHKLYTFYFTVPFKIQTRN